MRPGWRRLPAVVRCHLVVRRCRLAAAGLVRLDRRLGPSGRLGSWTGQIPGPCERAGPQVARPVRSWCAGCGTTHPFGRDLDFPLFGIWDVAELGVLPQCQ